jgi:hypothetical protein
LRYPIAAALSLLLSGCFYYPRTVEYYDAGCEIHARRMVLESQVMAEMCSGATGHEAAVGCLVVLAGVTAASAAVSGSIVVVGNTVYWFEKRGRCIGRSTFT